MPSSLRAPSCRSALSCHTWAALSGYSQILLTLCAHKNPNCLQADTIALQTRETERTEAAALLERRMAAMEAVLAARRKVLAEPAKPEAARGPGADLRFGVRHTCCRVQSLVVRECM